MRKLISLAIAFILCHVTGAEALRAQTRRERADKAGVLVGTAVVPELFSDAPYAERVAREFNMIEAEMKWSALVRVKPWPPALCRWSKTRLLLTEVCLFIQAGV